MGLSGFFDCVVLNGSRLGEAFALKWKHVDWSEEYSELNKV